MLAPCAKIAPPQCSKYRVCVADGFQNLGPCILARALRVVWMHLQAAETDAFNQSLIQDFEARNVFLVCALHVRIHVAKTGVKQMPITQW